MTSTIVPGPVKCNEKGAVVCSRLKDIVSMIAAEVTHPDHFSPTKDWPTHKREGRVTEMFQRFQRTSGGAITSVGQALSNRPIGLISETNWAVLCKHFSEINTPNPINGKSKSESCSSSRKKVKYNHGFGRTSIAAWSNKYVEKYNKEPTVGLVFDKGYLRIDAIKSGEDPSTSMQNPNGLCSSNELREISQKLHNGVEELIATGTEESVASTKTVIDVLGRCRLGVSQSKQDKGQSVKRMKTIHIEEELAESKAYSASLERRIARLEAACMPNESSSSRREEEEDEDSDIYGTDLAT